MLSLRTSVPRLSPRSIGSTRWHSSAERPPPPTRQPVVEVFDGPVNRKALRRKYVTEHARAEPPQQPRPLLDHSPSPSSSPSSSSSTPPPPNATKPNVELFSDTSKPRPYYAKHPPFRDLPRDKSKLPALAVALALGFAAWGAFYTYATNQEKLSSSVYRSIVRALRVDPQLRDVLGEAVRPQPEWYLNGDPLINGKIAQIQGNIDVSFRVKGSKGAGTVYFTSIRKEKGVPFTVLRFKVICDDGTIINISDSTSIPTL